MKINDLKKMNKWDLMKLFTQKILIEDKVPGVICSFFPTKKETLVFRKRK